MRPMRSHQNLLSGSNASGEREASLVQKLPKAKTVRLEPVASRKWNDCAIAAYATAMQMPYDAAEHALTAARVYGHGTGCHPGRFLKFLQKRHSARSVWPLNPDRRAILFLNWSPEQEGAWGHAVVHNPGQGIVGETWGRVADEYLAKVVEL